MKQAVWFQRIEAFTLLAASTYFYWKLDYSFLLFVAVLFAIDIFILGYAFNQKLGAYLYNIGHSLIIPCVLLLIGSLAESRIAVGLSLIWFAHVGMDRTLGYGLKLTSGFRHTHLGDIGK